MQRMTNYLAWGVVTLALFSLGVLGYWPDGDLHLVACDVGQGDAILIYQGFDQVLVDGGRPNGQVLECLGDHMPFWDRTIELVVISHPQFDHMGGLIEVLERYEVETVVVSNALNDAEFVDDFLTMLLENEVGLVTADQGELITLGEMKFEVLWPDIEPGETLVWQDALLPGEGQVLGVVDEGRWSDINDASLVLHLRQGEFDALLTGDISSDVERVLLEQGLLEDVEVLKVAHHGSKSSSSGDFLSTVMPEIALIQVGESNSYGHPDKGILARLEAVGAEMWRTDRDGEVEVVSDGVSYGVE